MPLKLIESLKCVFHASGNNEVGITAGHESLNLFRRELTKCEWMALNWRSGEFESWE